MTDVVLKAVTDGIAKIDNAMQEKFAGYDAALRELGQKSDMAEGDGRSGSTRNPLANIGSDVAVKAFAADRSMKSANVKLDMALPLLVKAVTGDAGAEQYAVAPQRDNGLYEFAGRRLSVFDVLPRLKVTSNAFEYNQLDGYASAAAYQTAEGAGKAAGTMPTDLVSAPITTIAHYVKLSEQVLSDAPALVSQVNSLLTYGVLAKASAEILAGATAGKIQGLATQATAYIATGSPTLADAIGKAATALDVAGWQANVVFMHPTDLFAIRSERTADGYVASGWVGGAEQTIWGLRAVADPSIAAGSPIVLDSSQVAILDREQTRVEFGRSGTDMTDNLITALGECRIGLAVFSPSAVLEVAITA